MGNRAVIAFSKDPNSTGIYIHWNGGLESVLAFLEVCKRRNYRDPSEDPQFALARLIGVIHEFFDKGTSLGVGPLRELDVDNDDNGAYLVGKYWKISERWGVGYSVDRSLDSVRGANREKYDGIVSQLMGEVKA
jgi:hypothetical protein